MSYQATDYVRQLTNLSPVEKAVAYALACHADNLGQQVRPSMTTTARESGVKHRQTASNVMKRLVKKGILGCSQPSRGGYPAHYYFQMEPQP